MIIWMTGLSGAGKTTLCNMLGKRLVEDGFSVQRFDGDEMRRELRIESDFSRRAIIKNNMEVIRRILSAEDKSDFTLVSLITPFQQIREEARKMFGERYLEVYVKCDHNTLVKRDTKGLYAKALNREIDNLIGMSDQIPFEEPLSPDMTIDTGKVSSTEATDMIYERLRQEVFTTWKKGREHDR